MLVCAAGLVQIPLSLGALSLSIAGESCLQSWSVLGKISQPTISAHTFPLFRLLSAGTHLSIQTYM